MLFGDEHVRRYEETNGEVGHRWEKGTTTLILTAVGRKTGRKHKFPLIYREIDGNYVIVASNGGADKHPDWYFNLVAHPEAEIQVGDNKFTVRARTAEGDERAKLWSAMAEVWPDYDNYQRKTDREIPIVVLDRTQ